MRLFVQERLPDSDLDTGMAGLDLGPSAGRDSELMPTWKCHSAEQRAECHQRFSESATASENSGHLRHHNGRPLAAAAGRRMGGQGEVVESGGCRSTGRV